MTDPKDWRRASIRELGGRAAVQTGPFGAELHAEDYVTSGVPLVLIRNIGKGEVYDEGMPLITLRDAQRLSNYSLEAGDIVFSRVGRVGSCFLVSETEAGWIISGQLLRLRIPDETIDKRFLLHQLLSKPVQAVISGKSVGTTRQSINTTILENLIVRLPSQVEQRRIAPILDAADEAIHATERIVRKLNRTRQALLSDLLSRNAQTRHTPLAQCLVGAPTNGVYKPTEHIGRGCLIVGQTAISDYQLIDFTEARHCMTNDTELGIYGLEDGDILLSRVFATLSGVGQPAFVDSPSEPSLYESNMMRLRIDASVAVPKFIFYCLQTDGVRRQIIRMAKQSNQASIDQPAVKSLMVPLPSIAEQQHICRRIESVEARRTCEENALVKLVHVKVGLMDDLLTGRVRLGGAA
jgi:type I restriction enzyme S subunit